MASPGIDNFSASQEMQYQVEALSLAQSPPKSPSRETQRLSNSDVSPSSSVAMRGPRSVNLKLTRGTTSDGVGFYTCNKWEDFYPNQEVAMVTSIRQPPIPPEGYVPVRLGYCRTQQTPEAALAFDEDTPNGFSLDTLLWNEHLLEERIMQLTAWTRQSPLSRRQKFDRINRLVNKSTIASAGT
ncbi:hypothetical protein CCR75_002478 [Bremia lactucae]|uniref:Uncharacterized protein n=1 Tax=Bremia lactucae TaxID=4779 RepID=A0A976I9T3_BRELC|nr:hypothetical protein CCR75_002478 [Bremia lactucae]